MPSYGEATTLSGLLAITTSAAIVWRLRSYVAWQRLWPILLTFIIVSTIAIFALTRIEDHILRRILGVALILISIYFMLFSQRIKLPARTCSLARARTTKKVQVGAGTLSHDLHNVSQIRRPCFPDDPSHVLLTHYYVEHHHQHETYDKTDGTEVGVLTAGGFRNQFFDDDVEHGACSRAAISSRIKNTKAEPSIVPSSGINSPISNVVVIVSNFAQFYCAKVQQIFVFRNTQIILNAKGEPQPSFE